MENNELEARVKELETKMQALNLRIIPVLTEKDRDKIYAQVGNWITELAEGLSELSARVVELNDSAKELVAIKEDVAKLQEKLATSPIPVTLPSVIKERTFNPPVIPLEQIITAVRNSNKPVLELKYHDINGEGNRLFCYFALAVIETNGWNMSNISIACRHRNIDSDLWRSEFDVPYGNSLVSEARFNIALPLQETHEIEFYLKDQTSSQSLCTRRYRIAESKLHEINIAAGTLPDRREISNDQGDRQQSTENIDLPGPQSADQDWGSPGMEEGSA